MASAAAAVAASTSCASPLLLPSGPRPARLRRSSVFRSRARSVEAACCCRAGGAAAAQCGEADEFVINGTRRGLLGVTLGASAFGLAVFDAVAAGLPPEDKPKLCDATCESELENVPMVTTESGLRYKDIRVGEGPSPPIAFQVAANYVAMVPNGQIFDSSLEKGQPYIFRVGSGQVIKGLDEGILFNEGWRAATTVHTGTSCVSEGSYFGSRKAKSTSKQPRRIRRQLVVHTRS